MPDDPGLSRDTCIYMEAVTGDGGVHNSSGVWWLSPDIDLNGPISGHDKADPGQVNPVNIHFYRKPEASQCSFTGDESLNVELWVGNPAVAMTPDNPESTALVDKIGSLTPLPGNSGVQLIEWTPPTGLPPTNPQSAGHKCLIARTYPDSLVPSATDFYLPDDPHVVQRNITILAGGGTGEGRPGTTSLEVTTANLSLKERDAVTLRVQVDTAPTKFVRETVLKELERQPGFKKLALRPPQNFHLDLRDFPDAQINNQTKPGCLGILAGGKRYFEAGINLEAAQVTRFNFVADLSGSEIGDAHIFHITQSSATRPRQGGLTIVMVAG